MMVEMSDDVVGELLSAFSGLEPCSFAWESSQPKQC
jgi:hypothetical protein